MENLLFLGVPILKHIRVIQVQHIYHNQNSNIMQTGEKFVDPTAMSRQMREVSDF